MAWQQEHSTPTARESLAELEDWHVKAVINLLKQLPSTFGKLSKSALPTADRWLPESLGWANLISDKLTVVRA